MNASVYKSVTALLLLLAGCNGGTVVPESVRTPELRRVEVIAGEESLEGRCEVSSMAHVMECGLYLEGADGVSLRLTGQADGDNAFVISARPIAAGEYKYKAFISAGGGKEVLSEESVCNVRSKPVSPVYPPSGTGPVEIPDPVFRDWLLSHYDRDGDGVIGPEEAASIEEIDIPTTQVKSLEGIGRMPGLRVLKCRSGKYPTYMGEGTLEWLDVSGNPLLEELWCEGNLITSLDLSKNSSLLKLSCKGNLLITLDVSKCPSLSYLDCAPMMDAEWQNLLRILYVGLDQTFAYANVPRETEIKTVY